MVVATAALAGVAKNKLPAKIAIAATKTGLVRAQSRADESANMVYPFWGRAVLLRRSLKFFALGKNSCCPFT